MAFLKDEKRQFSGHLNDNFPEGQVQTNDLRDWRLSIDCVIAPTTILVLTSSISNLKGDFFSFYKATEYKAISKNVYLLSLC